MVQSSLAITQVTHLTLDKMATILADDIFKILFMMKMIEFRFKFHWNLFPGVQLIIWQHSGNGLAPKRRQAITWNNADPVHRRIYAALGGDELIITQHCTQQVGLSFNRQQTPYTSLTHTGEVLVRGHGCGYLIYISYIEENWSYYYGNRLQQKSFVFLYYAINLYPVIWIFQTGYTILCHCYKGVHL